MGFNKCFIGFIMLVPVDLNIRLNFHCYDGFMLCCIGDSLRYARHRQRVAFYSQMHSMLIEMEFKETRWSLMIKEYRKAKSFSNRLEAVKLS